MSCSESSLPEAAPGSCGFDGSAVGLACPHKNGRLKNEVLRIRTDEKESI